MGGGALTSLGGGAFSCPKVSKVTQPPAQGRRPVAADQGLHQRRGSRRHRRHARGLRRGGAPPLPQRRRHRLHGHGHGAAAGVLPVLLWVQIACQLVGHRHVSFTQPEGTLEESHCMVDDLLAPLAVVIAVHRDHLLLARVSVVQLPGVRRRDEGVLPRVQEDRGHAALLRMIQRHEVFDIKVSQGLHPHPDDCKGCRDQPRGHWESHPIALCKLLCKLPKVGKRRVQADGTH
mmetsp:Transcript_12368/g.33941  ORF Transcript_12368/g.33941 Transcript_12368/m.33941 type:complete len:233 (-) Transcript_12368:523-1221(-)